MTESEKGYNKTRMNETDYILETLKQDEEKRRKHFETIRDKIKNNHPTQNKDIFISMLNCIKYDGNFFKFEVTIPRSLLQEIISRLFMEVDLKIDPKDTSAFKSFMRKMKSKDDHMLVVHDMDAQQLLLLCKSLRIENIPSIENKKYSRQKKRLEDLFVSNGVTTLFIQFVTSHETGFYSIRIPSYKYHEGIQFPDVYHTEVGMLLQSIGENTDYETFIEKTRDGNSFKIKIMNLSYETASQLHKNVFCLT